MTADELIARLRARAADPARRVDAPQSELGASIASMGLGDMSAMIRSLADDLADVVDANRAGRALDSDTVRRAETLGTSMNSPVRSELPGPADPAALDHSEADLGHRLPASFRRIYTEVADGGFGPGPGLLGIEAIVGTYRELIDHAPAPRGLAWPPGMVPLVHVDPGFYCLDLPGGRVIDWDPSETSEWQGAGDWSRSFLEIAPDVESWLGVWVVSKTPAEEREEAMAELRREGMRRTREAIAAMTPAEREAVGLPAEGWEAAFIDDEDV